MREREILRKRTPTKQSNNQLTSITKYNFVALSKAKNNFTTNGLSVAAIIFLSAIAYNHD
jgi:hypothetical protein